MGYNRFLRNITIRILLITLNIGCVFYAGFHEKWIFTSLLLFLLTILQTILLIRYVNLTNRELANFLICLKEQDVSQAFSDSNLEKTFKGLSKAFEAVRQEYARVREEKKQKESLIDSIINQIGTGIIAYNNKNEIEIFNPSAQKILDIPITSSIQKLHEKRTYFSNFIQELPIGQQKVFKQSSGEHLQQLLVYKTQLKQQKESLFIVSFQNVDRELSEKELESWSGLIRVLTHEIMNTLVPISTVLGTIQDCLEIKGLPKTVSQINQQDIEDSLKSTGIITNRIESLTEFVRRFRKFTSIPDPKKKPVPVDKLLEKHTELLKQQKNLTFELSHNTSLWAKADENMLDQVIQNVLINSIEALTGTEKPHIRLFAYRNKKHIIIGIRDNGPGIPKKLQEKIWTPFFTTKEKGSGIGLSLSRQIMIKHKGDLFVSSSEKGTTVKIVLEETETK